VWVVAITRGRTLDFQPLEVLRRRNVLASTLKHELAHIAINGLSGNCAPRWLAEGFAIYLADEGRNYAAYRGQTPARLLDSFAAVEVGLASAARQPSTAAPVYPTAQNPTLPADTRSLPHLYTAAYAHVARGGRLRGESALWQYVRYQAPPPSD